MTFDPMRDVPANDAQAEIALRHGKDELVGDCLVGIYQSRRQEGAGVRDAYQAALESLLEAAGMQ